MVPLSSRRFTGGGTAAFISAMRVQANLAQLQRARGVSHSEARGQWLLNIEYWTTDHDACRQDDVSCPNAGLPLSDRPVRHGWAASKDPVRCYTLTYMSR